MFDEFIQDQKNWKLKRSLKLLMTQLAKIATVVEEYDGGSTDMENPIKLLNSYVYIIGELIIQEVVQEVYDQQKSQENES